MNEQETELLRQLIENLDQFQSVTTESLKVLHRKIKQTDVRMQQFDRLVALHGTLLWLILIVAIIGLVAVLLLLLT